MTDITFLIDTSDKITPVYPSIFNAYNGFLNTLVSCQDTVITTIEFCSGEYDFFNIAVPIASAVSLSRDDFEPRYQNSLFDGTGQALVDTSNRFTKDGTPSSILFIILTASTDWASVKFRRHVIYDMIKARSTWKFLLIQPYQDETKNMGVELVDSISYRFNPLDLAFTVNMVSNKVKDYINNTTSITFSDLERWECINH